MCQQHLFSELDLKFSPEESASCDGLVSLDELTTSMKSLSLNKSPGTDGLTLEFSLCFWNIIGPLLCRLCKQCLLDESLPCLRFISHFCCHGAVSMVLSWFLGSEHVC